MKLSLLAVVALVGCHTSAPAITVTPGPPGSPDVLPPPNPVVPATDEDARACARLTALKCSDASRCMQIISDARTDHISIPSACLVGATDLAAVRKCGDAGQLTFDCR